MIELTDEEADVLRRLLRAVGGVVPEFIIAGGQAARLLRLHPLATRLEWNPLLTSDTDVATVDQGHRGNDLAKAFEAEGFTPTLEGDDVPPRTHSTPTTRCCSSRSTGTSTPRWSRSRPASWRR
jgi:hypothetical protein